MSQTADLSYFWLQGTQEKTQAPLCINHKSRLVEADCFQVLPSCFKFLRGVVSLDAGTDLTDLQANNVLAEVRLDNGLVSWGSEASTACLWRKLSQCWGASWQAGSPPAEVDWTRTSQ